MEWKKKIYKFLTPTTFYKHARANIICLPCCLADTNTLRCCFFFCFFFYGLFDDIKMLKHFSLFWFYWDFLLQNFLLYCINAKDAYSARVVFVFYFYIFLSFHLSFCIHHKVNLWVGITDWIFRFFFILQNTLLYKIESLTSKVFFFNFF